MITTTSDEETVALFNRLTETINAVRYRFSPRTLFSRSLASLVRAAGVGKAGRQPRSAHPNQSGTASWATVPPTVNAKVRRYPRPARSSAANLAWRSEKLKAGARIIGDVAKADVPRPRPLQIGLVLLWKAPRDDCTERDTPL